jgi:hypothetical protein
MNPLAHHNEPDPSYVFTPPIGSVMALSKSLWMTLTATLATRFDKSASIIRKLIPKDTRFAQYGRACQLEGGDVMHARELNPLRSDGRDMSFVRVSHLLNFFMRVNSVVLQYQLAVDKFAHQRHRAPEFELRDFFGQVLRFLVVNIPRSPEHGIEADSYMYAAIRQVKIAESSTDCCRINYYEDLGPVVLVDLNQIKCVVGRIMDRGKWAIIDRSKSLVQIHIVS